MNNIKKNIDHSNKFTGIKHVDHKILNILSDKELFSFLSTNTHYHDLYFRDQTMWMNRILHKFKLDEKLSFDDRLEIHKKQKGARTWKQYYVDDLSIFNKRKLDLPHILNNTTSKGKLASIIIAESKGADIYELSMANFKNIVEGGHLDVLKYLMSDRTCDTFTFTMSLVSASRNGHLDIVKFLVEKGADIHDISDWAFREASEYGRLNIVKYMVSNGANVNVYNGSALARASRNGHLDVVKHLIENGANVHGNYDNALISACYNGHLKVVEYLVGNGAKVNAQNSLALRYASKNGHFDIVKCLVENGAFIEANNDYAIKAAIIKGHSEIVKYLKENKDTVD